MGITTRALSRTWRQYTFAPDCAYMLPEGGVELLTTENKVIGRVVGTKDGKALVTLTESLTFGAVIGINGPFDNTNDIITKVQGVSAMVMPKEVEPEPEPPIPEAMTEGGFGGATFEADLDESRLKIQLRRVFLCMKDGEWRTLDEIQTVVEAPQASISARLRDLRKEKFGSYVVERRRRGEPSDGLFEYRVLSPDAETKPRVSRRCNCAFKAAVLAWHEAIERCDKSGNDGADVHDVQEIEQEMHRLAESSAIDTGDGEDDDSGEDSFDGDGS